MRVMADAVIYARYSSHSQRDASIEDQVRVCREAAERNGDKIVHVYADRAKSGTGVTGRTEFKRMIAASKRRRWKIVYVFKLDRFARNRYDAATYRHKLAENDVKLVSAMEQIGDSPESALLESVLEGFAEFYSKSLSVNIKRGLDGNALKCGHNGVKVFGYDLGEDGLYHVNAADALIVREAFERYASGESVGDIREAFEHYKTKRGNQWTTARICGLLKNEKYIGTYRWNDLKVEDGMPAIVDKALFMAVQSRLGKRHRRGHQYPLSGILFDADGRRFVGTSATGKRGKRYYYYWVKGTSRRIPQGDLEDCVYAAVADFLQMPGIEDRVVDGMLRAQRELRSQTATEEDSLRNRLAEIDREEDTVIDLTVRVGASEKLDERLRSLHEEADEIRSALDSIDERAPVIDESVIRFFIHKIVECEAPDSIMRAFVSKVVIDGDSMEVTFSLGDDSGTPSETAGNGGCSHRYRLVEQIELNKNTFLVFGPNWFSIVFVK